VLDLFGGSGALGFEALSRGAAEVIWCDSSVRSIKAIRENARRFGISLKRGDVLSMPALNAIRLLKKRGATFDLVFVDPPYESMLYQETLLALSLSGVTAPGGFVLVEHAKRIDLSPVYGDLILDRGRRYGETRISWYVRATDSEVSN